MRGRGITKGEGVREKGAGVDRDEGNALRLRGKGGRGRGDRNREKREDEGGNFTIHGERKMEEERGEEW